DRRAAGSSVSPDSESRRRRNHGPPKSGIPNRKKTGMHTRLSCKIDYLLRSNLRDRSIASSFFTDDGRLSGDRSDELVIQGGWRGIWVASINPIERYTVATANFHGHTDSYAPAALFKRIVEISFHTNLSAELGLRQLKRLAGSK